MAKVIMRYEVTNYKEIEMEVPDEVYERVMRAKTALEELPTEKWYRAETNERHEWNAALDELEEHLDFDTPYNNDPWADYIYINGVSTEDGEELIGW